MQIKYVAFDGRAFDTEDECKRYENRMSVTKGVRNGVEAIADHCKVTECRDCPFWAELDEDDYDNTCCQLRNVYPAEWTAISLPMPD